MEATAITDAYQQLLDLADGDVESHLDPDPTGDFAAGETHFFTSGEELLAFLESVSAGTA